MQKWTKRPCTFPAVQLRPVSAMRRCVVAFYEEFFKKEFHETPQVGTLYEGLPRLPWKPTQKWMHRTAMRCGTAEPREEQSLRNWGLPADFYKGFWPVIDEDLLIIVRDSLNEGQLPLRFVHLPEGVLPSKSSSSRAPLWTCGRCLENHSLSHTELR